MMEIALPGCTRFTWKRDKVSIRDVIAFHASAFKYWGHSAQLVPIVLAGAGPAVLRARVPQAVLREPGFHRVLAARVAGVPAALVLVKPEPRHQRTIIMAFALLVFFHLRLEISLLVTVFVIVLYSYSARPRMHNST